MVKVGIASLLSLALGLAQLASVDAWVSPKPVQSVFPQKTLKTVVAFIPEKNTASALTPAQANTLAMSVFKGYGVANRYDEYSSGAIKMTGLDSDALPTVKYIKKGINTCDRGKIVDAVYKSIGSPKPDRLIVVSNTRKPKCPGVSDGGGDVVMVYNLQFLTPNVMFHELGHTLSLPHPGTLDCVSKGKKIGMSSSCKFEDHESFQNMGVISYDQAMFKSDGVSAANPGAKGIMEYSAYNRLSALWPMLKESNVLDITGSGTYQLYNSETASIGDKTAVVRIPLSTLIKNSKSLIDGKVNYHTHYYVEFMQRRPNTKAGGLQNYVLIRSAPDHRAKPSKDTLFLSALSTDDKSFTTSFVDNVRNIKITLKKIDNGGATIDISVPSGYAPTNKANTCYFSSAVDAKTVVAVNGNKVCRAIADNNIARVGTFNDSACLTSHGGAGYSQHAPNVEYLHCTATPKWVKQGSGSVSKGFDILGGDDNMLCQTSYKGAMHSGRGDVGQCCVYDNGGEHCVQKGDGSITYLQWLTI